MTLLELCLVMGIVSVLFAMALLLTRHVTAITKIRRAQAELGQWHASLDNWFAQFGEYPCFGADGALVCQPRGSYTVNLENTASNACVDVEGHLVFFSEYIIGTPSLIDPWGTPYIYIAQDNDPFDAVSNPRNLYTLFSCGPDGRTKIEIQVNGVSVSVNNGDERSAYDDVYFEQ